MGIQIDRLLAHQFRPQRERYTERDAILYALGVGVGQNPVSSFDLEFLDETRLSVLPTFAVTLASPGMWIRDPQFGIDFDKLVHLEQAATFHAPLPPADEIESNARIVSLHDRGQDRGAILVIEREITSVAMATRYCTLSQTLLLRSDGGFGGSPAPRVKSVIPDVSPDESFDIEISSRAALIYRLSGDWNPLHLDPAKAREAGFNRPIFQGLGSYGTVGVELCRALNTAPQRISSLACRFASPITPGDRLRIDVWQSEGGYIFTGNVGERRVLGEGQINWER